MNGRPFRITFGFSRRFIPIACLFCLTALLPPVLSAQTTPDRLYSLDEALDQIGSSQNGGAELRWDPFLQRGIISLGGHQAAFMAGDSGEQGLVVVDTREILTLPLPYIEGGNLKFPEAFVSALKGNFDNSLQTEQSRFRIAAIIVDPGHGGKDSGAIGTHTIGGKTLQVVEKDVTLRVSKMLYARLAAAYPDKRIIMTREGDTFPALEDRVNIANGVPLKDNEAIIYISIHANASFTKSARGYEVWYLSPETRRTVIDQDRYADSTEVLSILNEMLEEEFTTESIMIAQSILDQFKAVLGNSIPSRGLKAEDWYVVKNSRMPSVLVELGFVTNEADALLLTEEAPLQKFSEALYKGIMDFITVFERSGGFTSIE